jgi:hypothetical protein
MHVVNFQELGIIPRKIMVVDRTGSEPESWWNPQFLMRILAILFFIVFLQTKRADGVDFNIVGKLQCDFVRHVTDIARTLAWQDSDFQIVHPL